MEGMDTFFENLLKITPWITIVFPAVVVILICFFYLPFIKVAIPLTLGFLFALVTYSVTR